MKVLFVYSKSTGVRYLREVISSNNSNTCNFVSIPIESYFNFNDKNFDWIIYNTFPAESHSGKFIKSIVYPADEKFHKFRGKKILLDSHDDGNRDSFPRFSDTKIPRIKLTPGIDFYKNFNVILGIPYLLPGIFRSTKKVEEKSIPLLYAVSRENYAHNIRNEVYEKIKPFNSYTKRTGILKDYVRILKSSKISITVPGHGPGCYAHLEALAANTMLLAHDSLKTVDILPGAELIDNYHYISFTVDNIDSIIPELLNDQKKIDEITANGKKFFDENYSLNKTREQLIYYLLNN